MSIKSVFGGASIGKDVSGYFKLSLKGLAARATLNAPFFAFDAECNKLLDVDEVTLEGAENFIYRLPVQTVKRGDLIITSEAPSFSAMFVQEVNDGKPTGLNLGSIEAKFTQPTNLFNVQFFIKVVSLLDGFGGDIGANNLLLPLLLLDKKGNNGKSDDTLMTLFLLQAFSGNALSGNPLGGNSLLLPLLLMGNNSDGLEKLLLLQSLGGGENPLGSLFGPRPPLPTAVPPKGEAAYSKPSSKP